MCERQKASGLVQHLTECGLWTAECPAIIEQIALFFANRDDRYYCCSCMLYGGSDCPDLIICPDCARCYCDECYLSRNRKCTCGTEMSDAFDEVDQELIFSRSCQR